MSDSQQQELSPSPLIESVTHHNDAAPPVPLPQPPFSPSSSTEVRVEHVSHFRDYDPDDDRRFDYNRFDNVPRYDSVSSPSGGIRDDTWSCLVVILTFWLFVVMTVIVGVYGTVTMRLGPNSSMLIKPNSLLVQYVQVEERYGAKQGPMLYGFYDAPALDVVKTWSQTLKSSVQAYSHKEWVYFLNKGSQINVSFAVKSSSASLFLVIAQGNEGLAEWLEDPSYPNTTLSWNVIHGSGVIQQDISTSATYYVALGNLNSEDLEVQLTIKARASLYNTTKAYYRCAFINGKCTLNVLFPKGNSAVLTSPNIKEGTQSDEWYVSISYGPRWIMYIVGIGGMTVLMLLAFNYFNKFQCMREDGGGQSGEMQSERAPLLPHKDDDLTSCDSAYDSVSHDEDDLENILATALLDGKTVEDGENSNNTRRLCAICFDAPRDSFFLPCGHCVSCYECGVRIAEASGTCPICRRKMKKVRKIFTV